MVKLFERIFDFLCSIKLAVIVILSLAVIASVGTIYEARYDATVARKMVYQSVYMYAVMIMLAINLIAVMIDRWPWQKRHLSFLCAHAGIILILVGGLVTQKAGIDGSMAFEIGQGNRFAQVDDMELGVYSSFDGNTVTELFRRPVDFFLHPPQKTPFVVTLGSDTLEVVDYYHYANRHSEMVATSSEDDGPALRIQLQNPNVNQTQWLRRDKNHPTAEIALGPAHVVLADGDFNPPAGNYLVLRPKGSDGRVQFQIYTQSKGGLTNQGQLREGEVVDTGWMGLKLRLIEFLPHAQEKVTFQRRERPGPSARSAVLIRYKGQEQWIGLNSMLKFFVDNHMVLVTYGNRRVDVGVDMKLVKFDVGRYQGTSRAASYQSEVEVAGLGARTISMNNPLDYNGYTFYQASFESDETGRPVMSVLSVNYDPGRWLKYLGSLLTVAGIVMLFWFKKIGRKSPAQA